MTTPKIELDRTPLPEQAESAFFLLDSMRVVVQEELPASGLYILGSVQNRSFYPRGDVEGEGTIGDASGAPGWLELADQSWHGAQTGRAPFKPYIEGYLSKDGVFTPSSRRVQR